MFSGSIYSVSLTNGLGFPLNYNLIFIIFGIITLVVMVMVACLPQTINKQKVVHNDEDIVSREAEDSKTEVEQDLVNQRQEQDLNYHDDHYATGIKFNENIFYDETAVMKQINFLRVFSTLRTVSQQNDC